MVEFAEEKWTTRRIVFDASKIAALKCKAATAILPKPTCVEVLSTLIWNKDQRLAAKLRKGIEEFKVGYGASGDDPCEFFQEFGSLMDGNDGEAYSCNSWCRFPFYTIDFEWGKPSWVTQCMEFKNMIVLTDTRDGDGIEASLTLIEEVMAIFESNKELLAYASLNPSVI
ncbi:BAHD acyltransferase [Prunus yedoensis var. nudiflora]|uniref:BAHD acyltransferase n=1 Tax=Prunus yedoensis var. nudiflora TaxID=2094558 RepID=A0A314Z7Y0_PRUYE|nr:BAHD acyltransferase [Prunus yedoensis var. nudiflora]